ncbi:MAG: hypothetical protein A2Y25_04840 [Candidatus Melainabacteria bacterium GWF2_37_15]|nr:MAG: hypothetical protein A2Y25_04840 [Candidatus Melainabacteria bacterium GWF2_37_15]
MKLTKIFSVVCALHLAFLLSSPSFSIKEPDNKMGMDSIKNLKEGDISNIAKEDVIRRLQGHMNSASQTKIDKEFMHLGNRFNFFSQDARINLTLRDVDVASILRIIAKEGKMNVVIDESVMGYVSAELKNISLNEAMDIILVSEELEARVENNTIFVASRPVMAKKGLNRRFIKTFKLDNSDAVYTADILRASIFNKGYRVNEEAAASTSLAAIPAVLPALPGVPAAETEEKTGSSTGQSNLIDSKVIKGKVETLQSGESFGDAGKLASTIKLQHYRAKTGDITIENNDGGAIVIPDTRTNSILVAGLQQDILMAEEAVKYLDKPLKQVSIQVSLIELKKDSSKDLGLSTTMQGGKTYGGFNTVTAVSGQTFTTAANQSGIMLNTVSSLADEVAVRLNAMIYNEDAKLLANPTIVALSGSESLIKITDQVVNSVETTVTSEGVTYTSELADVGIVLNILPKIGDDDYVTMRIRPSITSALPEVLIGEYGQQDAAIRIVPISTREVILQDVRVKSGETLAIAGLTKEKDTKKEGKVPLLADIPILGKLFTNNEFDHEKNELIILITPTIIDDIARL